MNDIVTIIHQEFLNLSISGSDKYKELLNNLSSIEDKLIEKLENKQLVKDLEMANFELSNWHEQRLIRFVLNFVWKQLCIMNNEKFFD